MLTAMNNRTHQKSNCILRYFGYRFCLIEQPQFVRSLCSQSGELLSVLGYKIGIFLSFLERLS